MMGINRIRLRPVSVPKESEKRCGVGHCTCAQDRQPENTQLMMRFNDFYLLYQRDKGCRLKESTWETKRNMIEKHLMISAY